MALEFQPFDPAELADPFPTYRRLRSESPVHWEPSLRRWVLTRYADVAAALRDPRFSARRPAPNREGVPLQLQSSLDAVFRHTSLWMIMVDPPSHTRLRGLVSAAFTTREIQRFTSNIQTVADELLDIACEAREIDLVTDFAYPLALTIIGDMIGFPRADQQQIRDWSDDLTRINGGWRFAPDRDELPRRAEQSLAEFSDYLRALIRERRARPRRDLLSTLVEADRRGDVQSEEELLALCTLLIQAGHGTTASMISGGMLALLRNPDQLHELRGNPSLAPLAVEEMLRYDGPVQ